MHSGREERLTWGSRRLGSAVRLLPLRPPRPQMPPGGSGLSPRAAKSLCRLPAPRAAGGGAGVRGSVWRESSGPLHGITRKRCANKMQIKASRSSSEQRRCKFAFNFLPCVRGRLPGSWRRGRQGTGPRCGQLWTEPESSCAMCVRPVRGDVRDEEAFFGRSTGELGGRSRVSRWQASRSALSSKRLGENSGRWLRIVWAWRGHQLATHHLRWHIRPVSS